MDNMRIEKILNGELKEICYLIHRESEKECICIDPGYGIETIIDYINTNKFVIREILLTHGHFDHMLSCYNLQNKFGSNIYIYQKKMQIYYIILTIIVLQ